MEIKIRKKNKKCCGVKRSPVAWNENPTRVIVISFAVLIAFGTLLLMMPFSSADGSFTPFLTALFTATSATCVCGLVLVDTATYFSVIGQSVILFLIQVGGLGLVTFATLFNMMLGRKMRFRSMSIARESVSASSFSDISYLIRTIFIFSISFEFLGAAILCMKFIPEYGAYGVFISVFLSVSAFCNGGFDILGFQTPFCSVTNYADSPLVLMTLAALIVCGGLGFIVWQDIYRYHKTHRLSLHSKLVIIMTAVLIVGGTLLIALAEWNNPLTIGEMSFWDKLYNSIFLSVSTRTAGFNSFSVADMQDVTKGICIILMFIGASPASTGGGIKISTAVVLVMTVYSVLRDLPDTIVHKHKIDKNTVYKAMTVAVLAMFAVGMLSLLIICAPQQEHVSLLDAVFESTSAFGTVGISNGVTAIVNTPARIGIICIMFLGRVGPVSLGLSLTMRSERAKEKTAYQQIPEGKLLVG